MLGEYLGEVPRPHIFIVLGKGGVGKTTIAIALTIELSRKGRTLLVSLDPAKHLLEYLNLPEPGKVSRHEGFDVYQFDLESAVVKLAGELQRNLEDLTPSLKVLNAESALRAARYTPGLEEDAILRELSRLYRLTEYDYIVVDTPPTGLALRVLVLPELYASWLNGLIDVRSRILSLRYTIERVKGGERKVSDPVLEKLIELRDRYTELYTGLRNTARTSYTIVANPEPLPLYEMKEVSKAIMEHMGCRPRLLVMNKVTEGKAEYNKVIKEYCEIPGQHACIPLLERPPSNLRDVEELIRMVYDCCRHLNTSG